MVSNKKKVSCVLNQVNEYQFTDPVPIPMRGIVVAELAAVGISSRTSRFGLRDQMQVDISWKILTLARPSTQADIICEKALL